MQYFSVQYDAGFFCLGTAYLCAVSKEEAKKRVNRYRAKGKVLVQFDLRTLKHTTKQQYLLARKRSNGVSRYCANSRCGFEESF